MELQEIQKADLGRKSAFFIWLANLSLLTLLL